MYRTIRSRRWTWRPATSRHPNRPVRAIGRVLSPYAVSLAVSLVCASSWAGTR